jgi:hypothetical protein
MLQYSFPLANRHYDFETSKFHGRKITSSELEKNVVDKSNSQTNEMLAVKCRTNKNQTFCDGSSLISYKFHLKLNFMQFTINYVWYVE